MQYYEKKIKYRLHKKNNLYKCAFFFKKIINNKMQYRYGKRNETITFLKIE